MDNYDLTEREEVELSNRKKLIKRNAKAYREYEFEQEENNYEFI